MKVLIILLAVVIHLMSWTIVASDGPNGWVFVGITFTLVVLAVVEARMHRNPRD